MIRRSFVILTAIACATSCSSPTEPLHADVAAARNAWIATDARSYVFEVAMRASTPQSGFYRVEVADRVVVAANDPGGNPVSGFTLTIDEIWDRILAARDRGELNSALFNVRGVPVESDMGPWELDGGVHYSVRNFVRIR
jgi:hypothetical protein